MPVLIFFDKAYEEGNKSTFATNGNDSVNKVSLLFISCDENKATLA